MDSNLKSIQEFVTKYRDTLVVGYQFDIVVLRGWSQDTEDYYYTVQDTKGIYHQLSCVGCVYPLKGMDKNYYDKLKRDFQYQLNLINKEIR